MQTPDWQVPVAQVVLSGRLTKSQPVAGLHESVVHSLPSLHVSGVPVVQPTPGVQVSVPLHALPSSHVSGALGMQPAPGMQNSTPLQMLPSLHCTGEPATQPKPAEHVSTPLHTSPSLQLRTPVGVHVPPVQASPVVQALSSVQITPETFVPWLQPVASEQASFVQTLPSSHLPETVPTHAPDTHWSTPVQKRPSLQTTPLNPVCVQPRIPAQASAVHGLPSSQKSFSCPVQTVPTQRSTAVHGSPSSHVPGNAACVQPDFGSQASVVQAFKSSQSGVAVPARHTPS